MSKPRKQWVYSPPKPTIPPALKQEVEHKAQLIIANWKQTYIQPPPSDPQFNYLIDLWTKWYRGYFYFCGTYASPYPNAIAPTFEVRYARMEYVDNRSFNLAYMRHTGQWWEIFTNLPLDDALHTIATTPHFHPS
jgi:hypothetical protein